MLQIPGNFKRTITVHYIHITNYSPLPTGKTKRKQEVDVDYQDSDVLEQHLLIDNLTFNI
jgi:hypothetical protein